MNNANVIESKHGQVCVINRSGEILIQPKVEVDKLYFPSNDYCQVEKDGKFGYINDKGELVIPFQFKEAYPFSENGLAFVVCENGLGGYINTKGEFVIEPIYESGSIFRFGLAAVSKDEEYYYIYNNGKKAITKIYNYASGFSECGLAVVEESDGNYALIDSMARTILNVDYGVIIEDFKENARVTKCINEDGKEALIDASGDIITPFCDQIIISPYFNLHPFLYKGNWGFMNDKGGVVIPNDYLEVSEFNEDFIALVKAYDENGNIIEFYINIYNEVLDSKLVNLAIAIVGLTRNQTFQKYEKVNRFIKGAALAAKKTEDEIANSTNENINGRIPKGSKLIALLRPADFKKENE